MNGSMLLLLTYLLLPHSHNGNRLSCRHTLASVDDKHDFIAKEAYNMFSNAGTNIDLEQAKYFTN